MTFCICFSKKFERPSVRILPCAVDAWPELGGHEDLIPIDAATLDCTAHCPLVHAYVGGIDAPVSRSKRRSCCSFCLLWLHLEGPQANLRHLRLLSALRSWKAGMHGKHATAGTCVCCLMKQRQCPAEQKYSTGMIVSLSLYSTCRAEVDFCRLRKRVDVEYIGRPCFEILIVDEHPVNYLHKLAVAGCSTCRVA
jgi:hypothetical protein